VKKGDMIYADEISEGYKSAIGTLLYLKRSGAVELFSDIYVYDSSGSLETRTYWKTIPFEEGPPRLPAVVESPAKGKIEVTQIDQLRFDIHGVYLRDETEEEERERMSAAGKQPPQPEPTLNDQWVNPETELSDGPGARYLVKYRPTKIDEVVIGAFFSDGKSVRFVRRPYEWILGPFGPRAFEECKQICAAIESSVPRMDPKEDPDRVLFGTLRKTQICTIDHVPSAAKAVLEFRDELPELSVAELVSCLQRSAKCSVTEIGNSIDNQYDSTLAQLGSRIQQFIDDIDEVNRGAL
jgi:hypothetical protein